MNDFNDIKEQIRNANDIVDIIGKRVNLKKNGGDGYVGLCPFHHEKTPSFTVSRSKQIYHCFGCHKGGDVFKFIEDYENVSFMEAMEILADNAGIVIPKFTPNSNKKIYQDMEEANRDAANFFHKKLKSKEGLNALKYLNKRGLNDEIIFKFGLGYAPDTSDELYNLLKEKYNDKVLTDIGLFTNKNGKMVCKFFDRIIYPITNERGKVIGFGGRVMGDSKPKYLNSPESFIFNKRKNLYALQYAKKSKRKGIILSEGYMDVISMHKAGFDNAVASLGTALTKEQVLLLKKYTKSVYLMYDSDNAGINAAIRAIPLLREEDIDVYIIDMYPYKDPDELIMDRGKETLEDKINNAENAIMFIVENAEKKYDLTKPEETTRFQKEVIQILSQINNPLERNNYIKNICSIYEWDQRTFARVLSASVDENVIIEKNRKSVYENRRTTSVDKGVIEAERVIIKFLSEKPEYKDEIKKYLQEEDFHSKMYTDIIKMLYNINSVEKIQLNLIRSFDDDDYTNEISIILNETKVNTTDMVMLDNTIKEAIIAIKTYNLKSKYQDTSKLSSEEMQKVFKEKQLIDTIKNTTKLL